MTVIERAPRAQGHVARLRPSRVGPVLGRTWRALTCELEDGRGAVVTYAPTLLRATLVLGAVVLVLFLLTRQILRETALVNSPSFDALVYQNQSYDDYSLLREGGIGAVLEKYSSGRWSAPP